VNDPASVSLPTHPPTAPPPAAGADTRRDHAEPPFTVQALRSLDPGVCIEFRGVYLVRTLHQRVGKNGKPFISIELGDQTGSFRAIVFNDHPAYDALGMVSPGEVVRVLGRTEFYLERLSPRIESVELVDEDELLADPAVLDALVERSPLDPAALTAELALHVERIGHEGLRAAVRSVFSEVGETFASAPAAVSMHHAYRYGLVEHTVRMARAATALLPLYPEVHADLALAGVLLHDVGKTIEYDAGLAIRRTRRGLLQGHVVIGYQLVRKHGLLSKLAPELLERLEHIVLSHQGELEWGAAAQAATPEAVFVSLVDNLDAKMGMVQRALRVAGDAHEFSEYQPGLKARLLVTKPRG